RQRQAIEPGHRPRPRGFALSGRSQTHLGASIAAAVHGTRLGLLGAPGREGRFDAGAACGGRQTRRAEASEEKSGKDQGEEAPVARRPRLVHYGVPPIAGSAVTIEQSPRTPVRCHKRKHPWPTCNRPACPSSARTTSPPTSA